jgi:peptidyl-prolyl cis-trans isomerase A (cyclophilin A)|tara:strand:+ start:1015 stop:1899 length:885 start_codon:yes stop_codon:yes gene_type:complete
LVAISVSSVQAQTQVKVTTNLGEFSLELFDTAAPGTVSNFLDYVTSGRFKDSVVHRSVPNFVIQGGQYFIPAGTTNLNQIQIDGTIANEFNQSNLRGTIAMAKVAGNPDSATSQWFINVANNTFLDSDNGGFTVFGRVLGDGMQVVDAINQLQRVRLSAAITEMPVVNFTGALLRENLVLADMEVVSVETPPALNRFDDSSNQLILNVDAGSAGIFQIAFSIETQDPQVIVRALPTSLSPKATVEAGFSTFNEATGQLTIPELEVSGQVAYRNLILSLTDSAQLLFTLQSFETP